MNKRFKSLVDFIVRNSILSRLIYRRLSKTQYSTAGEYTCMQNRMLQKLVRHCYKSVPYYTELFRKLEIRPEDIKTVKDLDRLPFMDKNTVNENMDKLQAKNSFSAFRWISRCETTSGTTGIPMKLKRDYVSILFEKAVLKRHWKNAGDTGGRRVILRGNHAVPVYRKNPPFWYHCYLSGELVMSSYHLCDDNAEVYIKKILSFKPRILYAYPSTAWLLAKCFADRNLSYCFDGIFTSSEMLTNPQREFIESTFKCRVADWYGQSERVAAIGQCRCGIYHIIEDYSIVELVDTPEGTEIVGTGLYNYVMPLLRYRTGDLVTTTQKKCSCGSHFRTVSEIIGRKSQYVYAADGRKIPAALLGSFIKEVDSIGEFQIVQEEPGKLEVRIIPNRCFVEADREKICEMTRNSIGHDMSVEVAAVKELPKGPNGKLAPLVVCGRLSRI